MSDFPERIVCLSAEAADWLARIGVWSQVVGVTAFFEAPAELPHKPRISGFSTARLAEIEELQPDWVIGFSDVQAELAAELIRRGISVTVTNQRTLDETRATLALFARMVNRPAEAAVLLREFDRRLAAVELAGPRPRVYFEEWHEPLVTGIAWVSELIERAGGHDVFDGHRGRRAARERVVSADSVVAANPDIMIASWCGKRVDWDEVQERPGWSEITALRSGHFFEISSRDVLQPGFGLVTGYERLKQIISECR